VNKELLLVLAARDTASAVAKRLGGSLGGLDKATRRVGSQFATMGGKIAKGGAIMAGVAVAGVASLVTGLGLAVKASAEEAVGIDRLRKALENNIPAFDGNVTSIEATIRAREKLAFSDDALRDSLGQLVTRTHDVNKAFDLQRLAMDLARAKGIDLSTATGIIGKVYSGNVGILTRYGIAVDKGATSTEALAAIQKATAGQAEAYGKTTKGAYEAFQIAIADVVEDIGSALMPAVTTLAQLFTNTLIPIVQDVAARFQAWVDANKPLIDSIINGVSAAVAGFVDLLFNRVIPGAAAVAGAIGDWVTQNQPLIDQIKGVLNVALQALGDAVKWAGDNLNIVVPFIAGPLVAALAAWALHAGLAAAATLAALAPLALISAAIGVLAVAWVNNWGGIQQKVEAVVKVIQPIFEDVIVPAIQAVIDIVAKVATEFGKFFNDVIAPAIGGVLTGLGDIFNEVIVPAARAVLDIIKTVTDAFSWLFDNVIHPALEPILGVLRVALDGVGKAISAVLDIIRSVLGPLGDLLGTIRDVVNGLLDIIGLGPKAGKAYTGPSFTEASNPRVRQHGGIVQRGMPYIVGERRPELFVPDVTGRVLPSAPTGLGLVVNVTVNGAEDPEQWSAKFVQGLARKMRREGLLAG
jgi:hypothetical protein